MLRPLFYNLTEINMSELDIPSIERDIAKYKGEIKLLDALNRLEKNADYKLLIGNGYLKEEALRIVSLRTDPSTQSELSQRNLIRDIDGIASFQDYLRHIRIDGENAKNSVNQSEQTLEAALIEENQE